MALVEGAVSLLLLALETDRYRTESIKSDRNNDSNQNRSERATETIKLFAVDCETEREN